LQAGEGTRTDVLALQGQSVELEVEIAERRRDAHTGRLALARLLGRPSDEASWPVAPLATSDDAGLGEADWTATALERRPEIAAASWELAAFGGDLRAARLVPFDGLDAGADSERDDGWSVGPAASIPLPVFDWGQAARARAKAGLAGAGHRLTAARRSVVMEVRQAFAERAASADILRRVRDELIPLVTRRREQAEDAYRSGLSGLVELLLADEELQTARAKAIELERRLIEAQIRLERAVGGVARLPSTSPTTAPATTRTGTTP
jgi:cobalt-zinc-cadmium efflux system outer membrane protein